MIRRHIILSGVLLILIAPGELFAGKSGFETYGDVASYAIPSTAAVITVWQDTGPDWDGLLQFGISGGLTAGIVQGLKHGIDRDRPNGEDDKSFPSSHTSTAFSGASYLHYRYGWQYGTPAYIAAAAVGASRVDADKHHVGDVIAGAAIANLVAFFLVDSIDQNVVIIPVINTKKHNFGILASFRF